MGRQPHHTRRYEARDQCHRLRPGDRGRPQRGRDGAPRLHDVAPEGGGVVGGGPAGDGHLDGMAENRLARCGQPDLHAAGPAQPGLLRPRVLCPRLATTVPPDGQHGHSGGTEHRHRLHLQRGEHLCRRPALGQPRIGLAHLFRLVGDDHYLRAHGPSARGAQPEGHRRSHRPTDGNEAQDRPPLPRRGDGSRR